MYMLPTGSSTNVLNYFNITTSNYTVSNPANSSNSSSTNSTNSSKITVDKLDILNNATEATINVTPDEIKMCFNLFIIYS